MDHQNSNQNSQEKEVWGCLGLISLAGLIALQGGQCCRDFGQSILERKPKEEIIPLPEPVNLGNGTDLNLPLSSENYLKAPQGLDGREIKIPPYPKEKTTFNIIPIFKQLRWPRIEMPHRPQDKGSK